jgi:hypothetical protein
MSDNQLNDGTIEAAANGNPNLRFVLKAIFRMTQQNNVQTGQAPLAKLDSLPPTFNQPPNPAQFNVVGQDGNFNVAITNPQFTNALTPLLKQSQFAGTPNLQQAQIYHELSSSATPQFDTSGGVVTYPASTATSYVFPSPNQTLYWRLRSSYDQKKWNSYQMFQSKNGVIAAVSSGAMSSASSVNNLMLNQSNFANIDSVVAGAHSNVRIYNSISGPNHNWVRAVGNTTEVLPAGTIINVTYGTNPFVAFDGEQYQLKPQMPQTFTDHWKPVGRVSVLANGGAFALPVLNPVIVSGHIVGATFTAGNGLTAAPSLTVFDSGGGAGAVLQAQILNGALTGVIVLNPGGGYTGATIITAAGGVLAFGGGGGPTGFNGGRIYSSAS